MISPQQSHSYHPLPSTLFLSNRRAHSFGFQWISLSFTHIPRSCQIKTVRSIQNDKNRYFEVIPESPALPLSLPPVAVPPLWFSLLLEIQGHGKSICVAVRPHSAECAPTCSAVCFQAHTHTQTRTGNTQFTTAPNKVSATAPAPPSICRGLIWIWR